MPRNAAVFRGDSICRCPWAHSRFVTNGRPTIYWIVLKFFLFCFSSLSPLRKHYAAAPNGIYIEINLIFKCIALVHKWKRAKRKKKAKWHSRKWVATSRNVANVLSVSFCIFFYIFLRRQPTITRAKTREKLRSRALAREMQLQLSITTNTTNKINKPWFCQNCKNCSVLF